MEVEVEEKEGEEEPPTGRAVLGPQGPCPSHLQSGEWGGGGETTTGRPGAVALDTKSQGLFGVDPGNCIILT